MGGQIYTFIYIIMILIIYYTYLTIALRVPGLPFTCFTYPKVQAPTGETTAEVCVQKSGLDFAVVIRAPTP